MVYDHPQVPDLLLPFALVMTEVQFMLSHTFKDQVTDLAMLLQRFGEAADVVQVDSDHPIPAEVMEHLVRHRLERGWAVVGKTKVHDQGLEKPPICMKRLLSTHRLHGCGHCPTL